MTAKVFCQEAECVEGGNGTCCHECDRFGNCVDPWKCEDAAFYKECKADGGGISIPIDIGTADLYQQEYARSVAKYTPEYWSRLTPHEMVEALYAEVEEVALSLWAEDFDGEHGIWRECEQVKVVAQRIITEMRRRKEEANGLHIQKECTG